MTAELDRMEAGILTRWAESDATDRQPKGAIVELTPSAYFVLKNSPAR